MSHP
jgi:two-component system response regulator ChvI